MSRAEAGRLGGLARSSKRVRFSTQDTDQSRTQSEANDNTSSEIQPPDIIDVVEPEKEASGPTKTYVKSPDGKTWTVTRERSVASEQRHLLAEVHSFIAALRDKLTSGSFGTETICMDLDKKLDLDAIREIFPAIFQKAGVLRTSDRKIHFSKTQYIEFLNNAARCITTLIDLADDRTRGNSTTRTKAVSDIFGVKLPDEYNSMITIQEHLSHFRMLAELNACEVELARREFTLWAVTMEEKARFLANQQGDVQTLVIALAELLGPKVTGFQQEPHTLKQEERPSLSVPAGNVPEIYLTLTKNHRCMCRNCAPAEFEHLKEEVRKELLASETTKLAEVEKVAIREKVFNEYMPAYQEEARKQAETDLFEERMAILKKKQWEEMWPLALAHATIAVGHPPPQSTG
ncbi:MAG: hypothetical protein Q9190_005382 [Brigantiaea leucoxantha]